MTNYSDVDATLLPEPDLLPAPGPPTGGFAHEDGTPSIPTATFFGFSLGMIGDRIFRDAPALLLLIYMINYLAIPPALAGVTVFIPKLLIIFVDPIVGTLSDRLNTPWGRRRPPMLAGATLASLSIWMFFHGPHFGRSVPQAIYMSVMAGIRPDRPWPAWLWKKAVTLVQGQWR